MARVNTFGIKENVKDLDFQGKNMKKQTRKMLHAGAEIVVEKTKQAAVGFGLKRSGQLRDSIDYGRMRSTYDGAEIDIYPQGTREVKSKKGAGTERNAVVGFVQHYGRRYGKRKYTVRAGRPFFDRGFENSSEEIDKKWEEMWDVFIKQRG
ncbi:MAG: HK97 gp10 family phage protein [Clostridia bacterium]|nr:HK97 gp10 family phage protein [Clostridia bacterium]